MKQNKNIEHFRRTKTVADKRGKEARSALTLNLFLSRAYLCAKDCEDNSSYVDLTPCSKCSI